MCKTPESNMSLFLYLPHNPTLQRISTRIYSELQAAIICSLLHHKVCIIYLLRGHDELAQTIHHLMEAHVGFRGLTHPVQDLNP